MSLVKNLTESERLQKLVSMTIFAGNLANKTAYEAGCNKLLPRPLESRREASSLINLKLGAVYTPLSSYNAIVTANTCPVITNNSVSVSDIATFNGTYWLLNANTTILANQTLTINAVLVVEDKTLTNDGLITIIYGKELIFQGITGIFNNNGTTTNFGLISVRNNGNFNNRGTIINNSSVELIVDSNGTLTNFSGAVINNKGIFVIYHNGICINNGIIYNNNGAIFSKSPFGTFTNNGTVNNPTVDAGCGIGTLVNITANGIACPP